MKLVCVCVCVCCASSCMSLSTVSHVSGLVDVFCSFRLLLAFSIGLLMRYSVQHAALNCISPSALASRSGSTAPQSTLNIIWVKVQNMMWSLWSGQPLSLTLQLVLNGEFGLIWARASWLMMFEPSSTQKERKAQKYNLNKKYYLNKHHSGAK